MSRPPGLMCRPGHPTTWPLPPTAVGPDPRPTAHRGHRPHPRVVGGRQRTARPPPPVEWAGQPRAAPVNTLIETVAQSQHRRTPSRAVRRSAAYRRWDCKRPTLGARRRRHDSPRRQVPQAGGGKRVLGCNPAVPEHDGRAGRGPDRGVHTMPGAGRPGPGRPGTPDGGRGLLSFREQLPRRAGHGQPKVVHRRQVSRFESDQPQLV